MNATLRTLYLYLCSRHLDASIALSAAASAAVLARITPDSLKRRPPLSEAEIRALPEFAALQSADALARVIRDLLTPGTLPPDPAASLEATAGYHEAQAASGALDVRAYHAETAPAYRSAAALVRGALAPMAETSDEMCGTWRDATDGAPWKCQCTRLAHADGPHVEHSRNGAPVAIWESESAGGSK